MRKPDPQQWGPYWERPTITSFGDMFPNNYDASILDFWQRQLTDRTGHIVDVACGNGALTWIANEILNRDGEKTRITGVDFADIAPFRVLRRNRDDFPSVRFIGNTPAEKLPFKDGSVDMVISQYGVEYTNLDETVPELSRVLVPAGRISLILHDKASTIIKGATAPLADFRTVLNDIAIHDAALRLENLYRRIRRPAARNGSTDIQGLVSTINAMANRVREIVRDYPPRSPIHLYMERLNQALDLARNNRAGNSKALIRQARDGLHTHIVRVEDLEAAALSPEGRRRLTALLQKENFSVIEESVLAYRDNDNIGTILVAER